MSKNIPDDIDGRIPEIVKAVIGSYEKDGLVDCLSRQPMPSLESAISILNDLLSVLFPRHFDSRSLNRRNISYHIGDSIDRIYTTLSEQIAKSFQHVCPEPGTVHRPCDSCMQRGRESAVAFLSKIDQLREVMAGDVQAAYDGDPAAKSLDEIIFSYPGVRAVIIYRIAHELHRQEIPLLPRIMTEYAHGITGVDIHPGATVGSNFFIDHATGVVIGETTEIGNNVKLYQGVTLGALSFPRTPDGKIIRNQKRHPTIEDDVTIYSGATILGPIVIGKGSIIGGNVWLTSNIPPGTRVIIDKPRLLYKVSSQDTNIIDFQI